MSDTQSDPQTGDYSGLGHLIARAAAHLDTNQPRLLLLGGDAVNDGANADEWNDFWQAVGDSLDGFTIAAAAGNHDNKPLLTEQFTMPDTVPQRSDQGWFSSFTMSGIHFTILDSNIMGAANTEDVAWLEADLSSAAAQKADWRIAVSHHPFWPIANIPRDIARAETMREFFLPIMETYSVDLLLVGHQHVYARSLPMLGNETAPEGIVQIMAASGDKTSYPPDNHPYLAMTAQAPNYVLLEATSSALSLTAYDAAGNVIDVFTLTKNPEG